MRETEDEMLQLFRKTFEEMSNGTVETPQPMDAVRNVDRELSQHDSDDKRKRSSGHTMAKRNMRSQRRGRFMLIGWSISRERHEVIDERGENTRRIDKSKLSGSDFVGGSQHLKSFLLDSLSSSAFYWPGRCFMFDDLRFYWSIEALPIRMFVNIRRWYMAEYVNVNFQQ